MASTSHDLSPAHTVVTFPSVDGACPSTMTPVTTSMPRFLNERATSRMMSSSHSVRMESSASRTVTFDPRSDRSEANSHPITPPPTTTTEAGISFRSRNSSEVITQRPSTSKPARVRGTEPAASTTLRPTTTRPASSPSTTVTRCPGPRVPVPDSVVTLRPFNRPASPFQSLSTTAFLRSWLTAKSTVTPSTLMPNSPELPTVRRTAAVSRNSLAGMQPRCRQVPPTLSRSTIAIDMPAAAP